MAPTQSACTVTPGPRSSVGRRQSARGQLAGATARLLARDGCGRRALLGEVGALATEDIRRKRLARHPHYVPLERSVDAGPAAVEDDDAGGLR
jgi:hypothetical protein